jgi:putative ubiquitin-RnfH superfamily antitoxin RatB of RatAB toxin-antitoxin module
MAEQVSIELVFATPQKQLLLALEVDRGATVADVISRSAVAEQFPDMQVSELAVGVWGKQVSREHVVRDGDRVEVYRQLQIDPREARRKLAEVGRTMGQSPND